MKNLLFFNDLNSPSYKSILTSIAFLENQSFNNFEEANHILKFPWWAGFSYYRAPHIGNIFQSAIIAETVINLKEFGFYFNESIISNLILNILDKKDKFDKCWKYFPRLKELPPDIDDLAQIIQVFLKYDELLVKLHCQEAVDFVIEHCANDDGSIDTWIYNSESQSKIDKRYSSNIKNKWGASKDPEVVANFIYSLFLIDKIKYQYIIQKSIEYLKNEMDKSFFWNSTWYWGKAYGTYMCTRILSLFENNYDILVSISERLISNKKNQTRISNPLEESFNLMTLISINRIVPIPREVVLKSIIDIISTQNQDGSWDSVPFIKMNRKKVRGEESYLSYQSSIITTSYCLNSILLSHKYF